MHGADPDSTKFTEPIKSIPQRSGGGGAKTAQALFRCKEETIPIQRAILPAHESYTEESLKREKENYQKERE